MADASLDGQPSPCADRRTKDSGHDAALDLALSVGRVGTFELDRTAGPIQWSNQLSTMLGVASTDGPAAKARLVELLKPITVVPDSSAWASLPLEQDLAGRRLRVHLRAAGVPDRWVGAIVDVTEEHFYARKLDELVDRYQLLVDLSPDGIVVHQNGLIVYSNTAAARFVGSPTTEQVVGSPITDFVHPDSRAGMMQRIASLADSLPGQATETSEVTLLRLDGGTLPSESRSVRTTWHGQPAYQVVMRDLSDRRAAERALRYQAALVRQVSEAIVAIDAAGTITSWNPAATRIFSLSAEEVLGRAIDDVLDARLPGDGERAELVLQLPDGGQVDLAVSVDRLVDAFGEVSGSVIVCSDITERRQAADALWHEARHDSLTGLPNRTSALEHIAAQVTEPHQGLDVVVVLLDLDHFKVVNDSLGHGAGDLVLCDVGARLRGAVANGDLVARLGGDEFVVVSRRPPGAALELAAELRAAVAAVTEVKGRQLVVNTSAGVVVVPTTEGPAAEDVLRDADAAMYQAKGHGRDRHEVFNPELRGRALRRLEMEDQMRSAMSSDQFSLVFQPVQSMSTGRAVGTEALLRWTSPLFGSVTPTEFIPVAEQSGLIMDLGRRVLQVACRQTAAWRAAYADLEHMHVAVNVSAAQLADPSIVDTVSAVLAEAGLPASGLRLEITESMLMADPDASAHVLAGLSDLGVTLSIDDFGTGYSSLAYLTRFAVHELKIDRSFVDGMSRFENDAAIVSSVIGLAHTLGLSVVAEGVETAEQLDALRALGCDAAQGYYLGRPAPPDIVLRRLLEMSSTAGPPA